MIPEGKSGDWRVERFTVTETDAQFHNLRCAFNPQRPARPIQAGEYTRLMRGGAVVMSDTPAEVGDAKWFVAEATGDILVGGLGLGIVARQLLDKPKVGHVTVVEISPDVISLVHPYLKPKYGGYLDVIQADIFDWKPPNGYKWDYAWYDIWDTICGDNFYEMGRLKRKFRRYATKQRCWCERETRRGHRKDRRWERAIL